ncbi:MAG TPA: cystathionine gamma-synthase [Acidimicrobiia bacterium]|nr:cystathionine gamma-synthase [Acidimicrobiia bacterium]
MTRRDHQADRPEHEGGALAFETRAIHAGQEPDPATGAVAVPIYQTSLFVQENLERDTGWFYSRTANPTRSALERCIASLEGATHGFCFGSGVAAEDAALRLLRPGDHLVVSRDLYGGTYRLLAQVWADGGLSFTPADLRDPAAVDAAWRESTRMVWIESPTNPRLEIVDIAAVTALARDRSAISVVDNTLASPYLQQPLALGADVVLHSTTKYLGGHSDVLGGWVGTSSDELAARLELIQGATGAVPGPMDAFLILRGTKTLAVRMERHCANAQAVAEFLAGHPAVAAVHYPGLPSHPGHDLAAKQMSGFSGMVSFTLAGGEAAARALCGKTKLFALGGSLGGVESLMAYPPTMSHFPMQGTEFAADPALIRLSVGIEAATDLIADLGQALARASGEAGETP